MGGHPSERRDAEVRRLVRGEKQEAGYLEGFFPADGDPEARRAMEESAAEVGAPRRRTSLRLKHGADDIDRFE